jgi:predicted anti-sigma-YlaC factor YlaD
MRANPSISCERTRALVSSGLDGRLHDLERRFLEAHVLRCAECKAFADEVKWFTNLIRTAPLESTWPVQLPHRRRRVQLRSVASVAAAAVILVVAGNAALNTPGHEESEQGLVANAFSQDPLADESLQSLQSLRRDDMVSGRLSLVPAESEVSLGAVKPLLPAAGSR